MLNHVLIGKRVEYEGKIWKVTGAKQTAKKKTGLRFRLLPLDMGMSRKEVWTPTRPILNTI